MCFLCFLIKESCFLLDAKFYFIKLNIMKNIFGINMDFPVKRHTAIEGEKSDLCVKNCKIWRYWEKTLILIFIKSFTIIYIFWTKHTETLIYYIIQLILQYLFKLMYHYYNTIKYQMLLILNFLKRGNKVFKKNQFKISK